MFQFGYEFMFCSGTFTMITFFLGNLVGVKKLIFFKKILLCTVSFLMCQEIFHGNSTILPKLRFFYFSVKAVSIGIPGSFRIPANADIWTINQ